MTQSTLADPPTPAAASTAPAARARRMKLSGWGNATWGEGDVLRPERMSEIGPIVTAAGGSVVPRGLGRSYGDAAVNDQGQTLLLTRVNRFLRFDPATGLLDCEAGATFEDILKTFVPRGFFPPVTPGTQFVTVGGAIAADVHGKNHHVDGSIAEFVESFDLQLASGQVVSASKTDHPEVFWATVGGMGLTGVILQARLKLIPIETSFISVDYQQAPNLDAALAGFAAGDTKYQYSVAWIDCLSEGASMGRSVLIRGNHAAVKDLDDKKKLAPLALPRKRKQTVPFNFPNFALSPLSVSLFNKTFYARHGDSHQLVDYDTFFYPLDSVLHWNRIYGKHGFFQYQAVFPTKDASGGLTELLKQITASGQASFLCVLKSMGKSSGGLLSFPVPGQTLALDIKNNGASTTALLRQLDEIVLKHGGRVYLAKDACLAPQTFAAMYPQLTEFNRIKAELDPTGRFSSSLARRLKIGAGQ